MSKLLLTLLLCCVASLSSARADVDLSKPLDLKFTAVDGRKVDLSQMRGKVVLIDFWATWCAPCRRIAPDIVGLYKKYHAQGLEVIGVSVDSDKQGLIDAAQKEGLVWPQYFDGKGADNEITSRLGIDSFPTLWLVNKDGVVVDANFRELWAVNYGIPEVTSDATHQKVNAAVEKLLK